jgi:hypothetical protein
VRVSEIWVAVRRDPPKIIAHLPILVEHTSCPQHPRNGNYEGKADHQAEDDQTGDRRSVKHLFRRYYPILHTGPFSTHLWSSPAEQPLYLKAVCRIPRDVDQGSEANVDHDSEVMPISVAITATDAGFPVDGGSLGNYSLCRGERFPRLPGFNHHAGGPLSSAISMRTLEAAFARSVGASGSRFRIGTSRN